MKIKPCDNFCRVFEIPLTFDSGFRFGGPAVSQFMLVDWFYPAPPDCSDWNDEWRERLKEFVKEKRYLKPGRRYLILTNFEEAYTFTAEA